VTRREKRVLVVDEDGPSRTLLVTVLRRRGLLVDAAHSTPEAVERLGQCYYALVLLNSRELQRRIRAIPGPARPLVIAVTDDNHRRDFDPELVAGTLHKPVDVDLLVETVAGCLTALQPVAQRETCLEDATEVN
jgi:CheY-like chemotaxis protein